MHQRWCPVLGLMSHIHITIPCALHFDSNDWNYFVFQLQKVWNYRILRNFFIQYCQPLSTPSWTNSTSQSYCLWKSPAFSTDGTTAVLTMFPRKSCVDVNVHMHVCTFINSMFFPHSNDTWKQPARGAGFIALSWSTDVKILRKR